jgi:hypothetical protein
MLASFETMLSPSVSEEIAHGRLRWWPQIGVGFYPVETGIRPYDRAYFDRLAQMAETDIGRALMRSRCALVDRHFDGMLVDVGSGCGAFIRERMKWRRPTAGWDVCTAALEWLEQRGLILDPWLKPIDAVSLWDVLEHIPDCRSLLDNVRQWVFLSLPIFRDAEHALSSKHYRTDEHYWYFTRDGLVTVMRMCGFDLVEENDEETRIGREDIGSFAFRRV